MKFASSFPSQRSIFSPVIDAIISGLVRTIVRTVRQWLFSDFRDVDQSVGHRWLVCAKAEKNRSLVCDRTNAGLANRQGQQAFCHARRTAIVNGHFVEINLSHFALNCYDQLVRFYFRETTDKNSPRLGRPVILRFSEDIRPEPLDLPTLRATLV